MSDRSVQSHCDGHKRPVNSMHPNQSGWMARWTRTPQFNLESKEYADDTKQQKILSGLEIASGIPVSTNLFKEETSYLPAPTKLFKEETEGRTVQIMNGLTMNSKNFMDKRADCKAFPVVDLHQNCGRTLAPDNDCDTSFHRLALGPDIGCNFTRNATAMATSASHFPFAHDAATHAAEISRSESHFVHEDISRNPGDQRNTRKFLEVSSLAIAGPSHENYTESVPRIKPYRSRRGRTPVVSRRGQEGTDQISSVTASKECFSKANLTAPDHEQCNYQSHSALLVCKERVDFKSNPGVSRSSLLRKNNASLSLHNPSASNKVEEQFQQMQNYPGIEFFPGRSSPPELTKLERIYHGPYALQQNSHSIHDMESMRICTTVDSIGDFLGVPPKYSHRTQSLLITKTDVNWSKENQAFRESRESTKLRKYMYSDFLSLSSVFGQGRGGVKLQSLESSSDSEGKNNLKDIKSSDIRLSNESSTDTDILDMDAIKEKNYHSGVNSSSSNKDLNVGHNLLTEARSAMIASTSEEVGCRWPPVTRLPDINEEFLALPFAANSRDNAEPSTSRTQSLDADHLLPFTEQPLNLNTSLSLEVPLRPEQPCERWIKRLKRSALDTSGLGTKISNLVESSSAREKANKQLCSKSMNCSMSSSEALFGRRRGKEPQAPDQTLLSLSNGGEFSSMCAAKRSTDVMLTNSWIQRWRKNRTATPEKKSETVVVCEPRTSKFAWDDFQQQQFPSIAAMALMGKLMRGFQPCEFRNRGSYVDWNIGSC